VIVVIYHNVEWGKVLKRVATNISTEYRLNIIVEEYILKEIQERIKATLEDLRMDAPNVAKIAGVVAFWVRKLKPFSYAYCKAAEGEKFYALNELVAIETVFAVCSQYNDDYTNPERFMPSERLLKDWIHSLRFHSHSPHSLIFIFELLTTNPGV
jgi:hypothetical protein